MTPVPAWTRCSSIRNDRALRGLLVFCSTHSKTCIDLICCLSQLFGLTPAEARLAAARAGRETVEEYAEQAGISRGTARWTLKHVMEKTGCRRQSELMLLLATSVAALLGG